MQDFSFYGDPKVAELVIKELGIDGLSQISGRKDKAIYRWKATGLPIDLERYLRLRCPKLKAWKCEEK